MSRWFRGGWKHSFGESKNPIGFRFEKRAEKSRRDVGAPCLGVSSTAMVQAGPCKGQGDPGGGEEAAGHSRRGEWGVREAGTMPGTSAAQSWWSPGLQAVESASQTRWKHRGGVCLYCKSTFGRLMGLESEVGVAEGPGGDQVSRCWPSKEGLGKDVPGEGSGETREWFVLGARPASRGDKNKKSCVLTFWLHREARGILVL